MKATASLKSTEVSRNWHLIDASEDTLGRIASETAKLLIGKHKPSYTPHVDNGDFVVVVNSDKLKITGNKMIAKKYYRHSQYAGALKEASLKDKMAKDSTEVIKLAVRGMIPSNKLRDGRLARLKIFKDENHEHEAQKPTKIGVARG